MTATNDIGHNSLKEKFLALAGAFARFVYQPPETADMAPMQALLSQGCNANSGRLENSNTLLIEATKLGCIAMVELLLAHGAQAGLTNDDGQTALHVGAVHGRVEELRTILALDASGINRRCRMNRTPLDWAMAGGRTDTASCLIEAGAVFHIEALHAKCSEDVGGSDLLWDQLQPALAKRAAMDLESDTVRRHPTVRASSRL